MPVASELWLKALGPVTPFVANLTELRLSTAELTP
jgi:hypothetical protein